MDIAIIDHDLAFYIEGILVWQPPWEKDSLTYLINAHLHIFFNSVKGKPVSFGHYAQLWKARITDSRLQEYGNTLPAAWVGSSTKSQQILSYIQEVRNNIDDVLKEVERILK